MGMEVAATVPTSIYGACLFGIVSEQAVVVWEGHGQCVGR